MNPMCHLQKMSWEEKMKPNPLLKSPRWLTLLKVSEHWCCWKQGRETAKCNFNQAVFDLTTPVMNQLMDICCQIFFKFLASLFLAGAFNSSKHTEK